MHLANQLNTDCAAILSKTNKLKQLNEGYSVSIHTLESRYTYNIPTMISKNIPIPRISISVGTAYLNSISVKWATKFLEICSVTKLIALGAVIVLGIFLLAKGRAYLLFANELKEYEERKMKENRNRYTTQDCKILLNNVYLFYQFFIS